MCRVGGSPLQGYLALSSMMWGSVHCSQFQRWLWQLQDAQASVHIKIRNRDKGRCCLIDTRVAAVVPCCKTRTGFSFLCRAPTVPATKPSRKLPTSTRLKLCHLLQTKPVGLHDHTRYILPDKSYQIYPIWKLNYNVHIRSAKIHR